VILETHQFGQAPATHVQDRQVRRHSKRQVIKNTQCTSTSQGNMNFVIDTVSYLSVVLFSESFVLWWPRSFFGLDIHFYTQIVWSTQCHTSLGLLSTISNCFGIVICSISSPGSERFRFMHGNNRMSAFCLFCYGFHVSE